MDGVLEFVSPSYSGQNDLTDHKSSGIDEHGCITTPDYQLIDEVRRQLKRDNPKEHMFF